MSTIQQNVELLREQLQQAETQLKLQQDKERLEKEQSWEYNMDMIKSSSSKCESLLEENKIQRGSQVRSCRMAALTNRPIYSTLHPFIKSVGICLERLERTIKQQQEKIDNLENRFLLAQEMEATSQTLALLTAGTDDIVPSVQVLKHRQTQLEKALCKNNGSSLAQNPSC